MSTSAQAGEFGVALQYGPYDDGYAPSALAKQEVTFVTNPADADTLTIAGHALTFKTTPTTAGHVQIGTTKYITLANAVGAIVGDEALSGVGYYVGTAPIKEAAAEAAANVLFLTSRLLGKPGNALTVAKSSTHLTLGGATLLGGVQGGKLQRAVGAFGFSVNPSDGDTVTANSIVYTFKTAPASPHDILIGADLWTSLFNLVVDMEADTAIVPSTVGKLVLIQYATGGAAGNAIALAVTGTGITRSAATLAGGLDLTPFDEIDLAFSQIRVTDTDYGETQMQGTISPEVGRVVTPTGAYKSGVVLAGGASMLPRLHDNLGNILLAAFGAVTYTSPAAGVGKHTFTYDPANETNQPFVAVRKAIPGHDSIEGRGLIGFDNKVALLRIIANAAAPIEARIEFEGRVPKQDLHPEVWSGAGFENFDSGIVACLANFGIPTIPEFPASLPVTQAVVEFGNALTGPREEMVLGSYFMSSIITRLRSVSVSFNLLWNDPLLHDFLFSNKARGTAWTPTPFKTVTTGGKPAFDFLMKTPNNIPGTETPYSLEILGNSIYWEPQAPVRLRGGDIITMAVRGTLLAPDTGSYVQAILTNGNTVGYSVPAEP